MEAVDKKESWNKKRIFFAIFLLIVAIVGGYFFKTKVLGSQNSPQSAKSVEGISAKQEDVKNLGASIQDAVKEKINSLKQEVSGLNLSEIASSSPQVQKIINDVKSLEQYPVNQAKEICKKICGL